MNKLKFTLIGCLSLFFLIEPIGVVSSHAEIEVVPSYHDFGEVELGNSSTTIVTITNTGDFFVSITDISLTGGSSSDFSFVPEVPPEILIPPPDATPNSIDIEVSFTPSSMGEQLAVLDISSDDPNTPHVTIQLIGTGVAQQSSITINDILAFFDAGVEAGTIQGTGPSTYARENHLNVFEWNLLMAAFFLDKGADKVACIFLWNSYERSDGQDSPRDFIKGQDGDELNAMILQLWADLGCE